MVSKKKVYEEIQGNNNMVKRLIFHNVEFLEYEVQYIFFLKEAMEKRNIIMPKTQKNSGKNQKIVFSVDYGTLLRFLYSNHFDKDKTCEDLKKHFQWLLGVKDKRKQINDKIFAYFVIILRIFIEIIKIGEKLHQFYWERPDEQTYNSF